MMAEAKTKATDASVDEYLAARANEEQRVDCEALMAMLKKVTKQNLANTRREKVACTSVV